MGILLHALLRRLERNEKLALLKLLSAQQNGTETRATIEFSDLQNVKARLAEALPEGEYTLKVYTRSGLGEGYGVHVATRKVAVA